MKTVRTIVLVVLIAVVAIPAVAFAVVWTQAAAAIARAERDGVLRDTSPDTALTVAERAIAIAEFESTWNTRRAPCRPIAALWSAATQPEVRLSGQPVSGALSTMILMEVEPERSLRWQFKRVLAACQLEQRYSDTQMLWAWLSNAYFGARPFGIESAAQSLFGKEAANLDPWESVQLAALLRAPRFRDDPERWSERARLIAARVDASDLP